MIKTKATIKYKKPLKKEEKEAIINSFTSKVEDKVFNYIVRSTRKPRLSTILKYMIYTIVKLLILRGLLWIGGWEFLKIVIAIL